MTYEKDFYRLMPVNVIFPSFSKASLFLPTIFVASYELDLVLLLHLQRLFDEVGSSVLVLLFRFLFFHRRHRRRQKFPSTVLDRCLSLYRHLHVRKTASNAPLQHLHPNRFVVLRCDHSPSLFLSSQFRLGCSRPPSGVAGVGSRHHSNESEPQGHGYALPFQIVDSW